MYLKSYMLMDLPSLKQLLNSVTNNTRDAKNILTYWEVLEYFQEITFPKLTQGSNEEKIKPNVTSDKELKDFAQSAQNEKDTIRLYVGGVPKFDLLARLYDCVPADEDNKRFRKLLERDYKTSVLYTLEVTQDGKYVEGSFQLSSYIWAISCLLYNHAINEDNLEPFLEAGNEFFQGEPSNGLYERLLKKTDLLLKELRIYKLFAPTNANQQRKLEKVCIRIFSENETDLNQSFYTKDLNRIHKSLQNEGGTRLLLDYINAPLKTIEERRSICSIDNYKKWLQPDKYPMGRWPSEFSPALMQQMAINIALADERHGGQGIFSVNGPPGTGKTTLLKDIIAEYIVHRAHILANLNEPDDAYDNKPIYSKLIEGNRYAQKTHAFKDGLGLDDYGILVASCNNTAVENITFELPEMSKLPNAEAMKKAGHTLLFSEEKELFFGELATNMLNGSIDPKQHTKKAWGLISARLGKSDNIRSFKEMVLDQFTEKISSKHGNENNTAKFKEPYKDFNTAKDLFLAQYQLVEQIRRKLSCNEVIFEDTNEKMQSTNPLIDAEFDKAREELFYLALKLHGSFLFSSSIWKRNLYSLKYLWEGKYSTEEKKLIFPHLLNSLFLLVPVVSTTFASVQKMLEYVGKEQLGLLIVDEAGQAAPQYAVGALWRAKKAIIVGDPKQVEPVVTTDETLMSIYQKKCRIDSLKAYMSKSHSVQGFADLINPYGAWIGDTWVGCPLVVHRRCINPMFGISNRVSYDETMILGTKDEVKEEEQKELLFPHSLWIDVPGNKNMHTQGNNHYLPEQGELCLRIILSWMKKHNKKGDNRKLYVISPFTTVINGVKDSVKKALQEKENEHLLLKYKSWANTNCGTVHKFQGKEAEEVIFILGCQPSSGGAIGWVNSNILNVAVTRAKKKVYFIGDYEVWSQKNGNFNTHIIHFSDEDTGLHRLNHTELPAFEEEIKEDDTELTDMEELIIKDPITDESDIDVEDDFTDNPEQEVNPIPKYSFLTGPGYRRRQNVIYSHPYQLIFEVLSNDPSEILPHLPASHYQRISDKPDLWMCLIYPSNIDLTEEELRMELDEVTEWYMSEE